MGVLSTSLLLLQPSAGGEAPPAEAGAEGSGEGAAAIPPADDISEKVEETARRFNSFDAFFKAENLVYLWETYGIPALKALVILVLAWIIAGWVKRILTGALTKAKVEITLAKFLANLARWGVLLLAAMSVLDTVGIRTTSFAAVIAAMGFAIGLALSGSLGNLAAGVMLMLFRPFKVGDVITTSGVTGSVDEIELFSTTLITPDNRKFIMPNGSVFNTTIENLTANPTRRVDVEVGVEYNADVDATRKVLEEAVKSVPGILEEPGPVVYLDSLGDSAVKWKVRAWAKTGDYWKVREQLTRAVKVGLDKSGLEIPFPQMVVHMKKLGE